MANEAKQDVKKEQAKQDKGSPMKGKDANQGVKNDQPPQQNESNAVVGGGEQRGGFRGGFGGRGRGGRGGFEGGRGRFEGGRGGFDRSRGGGGFRGGRGGFGGAPNNQQQTNNENDNQKKAGQGESQNQTEQQPMQTGESPNQRGGFRGGRGGGDRGRGGGRGGRGGGGFRGERREKVVHAPPRFTEDGERMFTGRCRLFIGNLPQDMDQEQFEELFKEFGEFEEAFISQGRGFGFIRMATIAIAKKVKAQLDGKNIRGRNLRVRFATHQAALKVKHLHHFVSNEMLKEAFESNFGEVEKAVVIIDDKGRPTGEGIVEFARKPGAMMALNRINDGVFLLGSSPRPIVVEPLIENDETDGLPEIFMNKNQEYTKERENGARFAHVGSFEYEFAHKWKEMYQMHAEAEENLKRQFVENCVKLEIEQANAQMEYQTQKLRDDLLKRQEELRKMEEQHKREMEMKMEMRRSQEENKKRMEEVRRQEEEERRKQQEIYEQQREQRMREMQEMQHMREMRQLNQMREQQMRELQRETRGEGMRQPRHDSMNAGGGGGVRGVIADLMDEVGMEPARNSMGGGGMRGLSQQDDLPMKPPPAPPAVLGLDGRGASEMMLGGGGGFSQQQGGLYDQDRGGMMGGGRQMDRNSNMGGGGGGQRGSRYGGEQGNGYHNNQGGRMGGGDRLMQDRRGGDRGTQRGGYDDFEPKRARRY